ncbi:nuclear transport factor 2 family protein [Streptomyces sp. NPDC090493]|uniref:nuclear transport factor 2 family protein n=1 Tax=Streptomyces sp. NPDC090493 TaxID=3365964 RepID=UPI00382E9C89
MTSELSVADRNREIVRKVYEVADSGALEELGRYLSDDYTLTRAAGGPVPGQWKGAEAGAALGQLFAMAGHGSVIVREIVADGPHRVVGLVDVHGVNPAGESWTMPVAELFWVEDGKVTDIRPYYWDLVEFRRIAGMD